MAGQTIMPQARTPPRAHNCTTTGVHCRQHCAAEGSGGSEDRGNQITWWGLSSLVRLVASREHAGKGGVTIEYMPQSGGGGIM